MKTALRSQGSIPPIDGPLGCVRSLDETNYALNEVQACLETIRRIPWVQDARVETNSLGDGSFVEFIVRAKVLSVREISYNLEQSESQELQAGLAKNIDNLQVGSIYSPSAEALTYQGIKQFYLAKGLLVGIIPTVRLDYNLGTSDIKFEIVRGPTVPPHRQPPYQDTCAEEVANIDLSEVDTWVPLSLVESHARAAVLGSCFDPDLPKRDEVALRHMGIFKRVAVRSSGDKEHRSISIRLAGKPLQVTKLDVRSFGEHAACAKGRAALLPLKISNTYTGDLARRSVEILREACSSPGKWVEAIEQDQLSPTGGLEVSFDVLVFPLQSVFVNGEKLSPE